MFNYFVDCQKFFCNISRYSSPVMFPSINTKLPKPDDEKHRQHLTFALACLPVVSVHLGWPQTMTFPSDPNKLNLLSSDQITLFQKARGFSRYVRAYSNRFPRFALLRYGFFRATRPYKPISWARRRIVVWEIVMLSSVWSSPLTDVDDFRRSVVV